MTAIDTSLDHQVTSAHRRRWASGELVVDLLLPEPMGCAPCLDAIEEIDEAAALLAPELAARGTSLRVRVTTRTDPATAGAPGAWPLLELRVNGVAIESDGTHVCGDEAATHCGTYEWDGATYAAPPAELLTGVIHDHLDSDTRPEPSRA
jgi:hypothetical protein